MNKDNASRFLPLVQALANGGVIQVRSPAAPGTPEIWEDVRVVTFANTPDWYRVKPTPVEVYIVKNRRGNLNNTVWFSQNTATLACDVGETVHKFREVLDD